MWSPKQGPAVCTLINQNLNPNRKPKTRNPKPQTLNPKPLDAVRAQRLRSKEFCAGEPPVKFEAGAMDIYELDVRGLSAAHGYQEISGTCQSVVGMRACCGMDCTAVPQKTVSHGSSVHVEERARVWWVQFPLCLLKTGSLACVLHPQQPVRTSVRC